MDAAQLLREALHLPAEARAKLAADLIDSLDESSADPDYEAAWADEIQRRLAAIEDGNARTVPAVEVLTEMRSIARAGHR